ncbi:MAG: polyphosphate--glucose phosphotransferase [Mycobacteriales bacterium]
MRNARRTSATDPRPLRAFGVDIGGSGIKGAIVDLRSGALLTDRERVPTPSPSKPAAVASIVATLVADLGWRGKVGATFPAVIESGVAKSAANVDPSWIGTDVDAVFSTATGRAVTVLNDADAAGLAEVRYGAAKDVDGVVIMLTFGTGIGSAMFVDGQLIPNTELGHLEIDGKDAEKRAAASVRERKDLKWREWAERVSTYLQHVEALFSPGLFVIGGGVSRHSEKWLPYVDVQTPTTPAQLHNDAGIVGAALASRDRR